MESHSNGTRTHAGTMLTHIERAEEARRDPKGAGESVLVKITKLFLPGQEAEQT